MDGADGRPRVVFTTLKLNVCGSLDTSKTTTRTWYACRQVHDQNQPTEGHAAGAATTTEGGSGGASGHRSQPLLLE